MHAGSNTIAVVALGLAAAACTPPPVGYDGPLPSTAARQSLNGLVGATLPAGSVAFCTHELRVHSFLVLPDMPAVVVEDPSATGPGSTPRYWIPVLQDGDIADLHVRIHGTAPAGMPRDTSERYRRMMTGR